MKPLLHFGYTLNGHKGICWGVSIAQALDNARLHYLKDTMGITEKHPKFKINKLALSEPVLTGNGLTPLENARLGELLRLAYKTKNLLDPEDRIELDKLDRKRIKNETSSF